MGEMGLIDKLSTPYQYKGFGRYKYIEPKQDFEELRALVEELEKKDPDYIMEIGTMLGGTFYIWNRVFEPKHVISINLPGGPFTNSGYSIKKSSLFDLFSDAEKDYILGDSHSSRTLEQVSRSVPEEGLDLLFIDGDHTYNGIKQDFEMYKQFVKQGGAIVFHDLNNEHEDVGVDRLWDEIVEKYESIEIDQSRTEYGIGVIYV